MVIIWRAARALSSCYARSKRVRATSCLLYTTLFCIYVRDCFHSLNLRPPFTINLKVIHFFKKLEKIIPWKWTSAVTLFISSACNFVCLCYYLVLVNYIPSSSGGNNRVIFFFLHIYVHPWISSWYFDHHLWLPLHVVVASFPACIAKILSMGLNQIFLVVFSSAFTTYIQLSFFFFTQQQYTHTPKKKTSLYCNKILLRLLCLDCSCFLFFFRSYFFSKYPFSQLRFNSGLYCLYLLLLLL